MRSRSPNAVSSCGDIVNEGNPDGYLNVNCFTAPGARELGNLGRNTVIGPGSVSWNPSLSKRTALTERLDLEFRTEAFNILNRTNFRFPANNLFTGAGGPIGSAGVITDTVSTARQLQFALKLVF